MRVAKKKIVFIVLLFVSDVIRTDIGPLIEQLPKIDVVLRGLVAIFSLKSTSRAREFLIEHWQIIIFFIGAVGCGVKKYSDWRAEQKKISNKVNTLSSDVKKMGGAVSKLRGDVQGVGVAVSGVGQKTDLLRDEFQQSSSEIQNRLKEVSGDVTDLQEGQNAIQNKLKIVATREQVTALSKLQQASQGDIDQLKILGKKTQDQLTEQGQQLNEKLVEMKNQQAKLNQELQEKVAELRESLGNKIDTTNKNSEKLLAIFVDFKKQSGQNNEKMVSDISSLEKQLIQVGESVTLIKESLTSEFKKADGSRQKINMLVETLCTSSTADSFVSITTQNDQMTRGKRSISEFNKDFD